jgi:hypothetical protein
MLSTQRANPPRGLGAVWRRLAVRAHGTETTRLGQGGKLFRRRLILNPPAYRRDFEPRQPLPKAVRSPGFGRCVARPTDKMRPPRIFCARCAHEPQDAQVVGNQGRHFEVHGQNCGAKAGEAAIEELVAALGRRGAHFWGSGSRRGLPCPPAWPHLPHP